MQSNYLSAKTFCLILALIMAIGIALPSLSLPWSLIDDGEDLCLIQDIDQAWTNSNYKAVFLSLFEPSRHRTRPFAWLLRWSTYKIGGNQPIYQHAVKIGLFGLTVMFLYSTAYLISNSVLAGLLGSVFFILTITSLEAYYRLGNTEPMLAAGMAASFFFLIKAQKTETKSYLIWSCLALAIAFGSKENAIALIPFSGLAWLMFYSHSSKTLTRNYFLVNCLLGVSLVAGAYFFTSRVINQGYTAAFSLNGQKMLTNFISYWRLTYNTYYLLLPLTITIFSFSLIYKLLQKKPLEFKDKWQFLFFCCFLCFLLMQTPWDYIMWRYLLVGFLPLSLFLALELDRIFRFLPALRSKPVRWTANAGLGILCLHFLFANGIGVYAGAKEYLLSEALNARMISYLANNIPAGNKVFMNFNGVELSEWFEESKLHLRKFYNRSDIALNYLYPAPKEGFSTGDYILVWSENGYYPEGRIKAEFASKLREHALINIKYSLLLEEKEIYWKLYQII